METAMTECWDTLPWVVRMGIYAHTIMPAIGLIALLIVGIVGVIVWAKGGFK